MKKVMIVVDSPSLLVEMSEVLEQHNLEPNSAKDEEEALSLLEDDLKPELIIADSDMLEGDAGGFVQKVRGIIGLQYTPILILGTEPQNPDQPGGPSGWLVKPFQSDQLMRNVRRHLPGV